MRVKLGFEPCHPDSDSHEVLLQHSSGSIFGEAFLFFETPFSYL